MFKSSSPEGPWIPGPEEIEQFRKDLDIALSSDFRELVRRINESREEAEDGGGV